MVKKSAAKPAKISGAKYEQSGAPWWKAVLLGR
jgi:hypothetical protein